MEVGWQKDEANVRPSLQGVLGSPVSSTSDKASQCRVQIEVSIGVAALLAFASAACQCLPQHLHVCMSTMPYNMGRALAFLDTFWSNVDHTTVLLARGASSLHQAVCMLTGTHMHATLQTGCWFRSDPGS